MRRILAFGGCLLVSAPAAAQQQPPPKGLIAEQAGNWEVVIQAEKTVVVRTVAGPVPMAIRPGDNSLYLIIASPDASAPNTVHFDTGLDVTMTPNNGPGSQIMRTLITAAQSPGLIHALTAGKAATLVVGDKTFPISLAGTSPAIDALNFFGKEHSLNLPPPFASAPDLGSDQPSETPPAQTAEPPTEGPVQLAPPPSAETAPAAVAEQPTPGAPASSGSEATLLAITDRAREAFEAGTNDMVKGASRPARARAICAAFPDHQAVDWTGTVETLSSSNDGHGVLVLRLGPHVTAGTTNNGASDALGSLRTLLDPGSPVFAAAAGLHEGQKVRFSGTFAASDSDCFDPQSLTQSGAMEDPEFLLQFSSIAPL